MKRYLTMIFVLCSVVGFGAETAIAFNEAHLKKLQAFGDCEQCDLSGATLTEADLRGANLKEAELYGAKLCKTQMPSGEDNSGC